MFLSFWLKYGEEIVWKCFYSWLGLLALGLVLVLVKVVFMLQDWASGRRRR